MRFPRPLDTKPLLNDAGTEPNTLVMADPSLAGGFIQLPRTILYATNISRDAKLLYAILLGYAWQEARCFPGYGRLCQDLQASENMVRKYMHELQTVGLLTQKRRGLGKTNLYTLCDLRTAKIEVLQPQKSAVHDPAKTAVNKETEHKQADEYLSNPRRDAFAGRKERQEQVDGHGLEQPSPSLTGLTKLETVLQHRLEPRIAPVQPEERRAIGAYVDGYAQRFRDRAGARSSTARACNLYRRAKERHPRLDLSVFLGRFEEAAAITRDCDDRIRG